MKRYLPLLLVITVGMAAAVMIYREPPAPQEVGSYAHNVRLAKPPAIQSPTPEAPVYGGHISAVSGLVEYKGPSGEWKRAVVGVGLESGSSLETFGDGRAVVSLTDGTAIRLDQGTMVAFGELDPKKLAIDAQRGRVYAKISDNPERVLTLTVGATTCRADNSTLQVINEEKTVGLEVYAGQVAVLDQAGATPRIVSQGYRLYSANAADRKNEGKTTRLDEKRLLKDDFVSWNRGLDDALAAKPDLIDVKAAPDAPFTAGPLADSEDATAIVDQPIGPLVLTGQTTPDGLLLNWAVEGAAADMGFKLLKSLQATPAYPGSDFVYVPEPSAREFLWRLQDGKTYHVRACVYRGDGTCGAYSNELVLSAPVTDGRPVSGISGAASADSSASGLTLSPAGGNLVRWTVASPSSSGFRLIWSKEPGPAYPGRDTDLGQYFADPMRRTASVTAFDGSGAYYVRICSFRDGKCDGYSNEISLYLNH